MNGRVVPEGERVTRSAEVVSLLGALYLLARITAVSMLAYLLWNAAQIVAHAARIYTSCGFVYWGSSDSLPRCMRDLISQRYWIDLIR